MRPAVVLDYPLPLFWHIIHFPERQERKRKKRGMQFIPYDYEAAYNKAIADLNEWFVEQMFSHGKKMVLIFFLCFRVRFVIIFLVEQLTQRHDWNGRLLPTVARFFLSFSSCCLFKEVTGYDFRKLTVYVLCNFNTTIEQDLERIYTLRDLGYNPFVMLYMSRMSTPCVKSTHEPESINCCNISCHSGHAIGFGSNKTMFLWPLQNSDRSATLYDLFPSFASTWQKPHPLGHPLLMKQATWAGKGSNVTLYFPNIPLMKISAWHKAVQAYSHIANVTFSDLSGLSHIMKHFAGGRLK